MTVPTRWVVVGGGTAGCVVAANLAHGRPADEVVLLEAGPAHAPSLPRDGDTGPFLSDPARLTRIATGGRDYAAGFGLGGSSLVNAGIVTGETAGYRHRLPLEPAGPVGPVGRAVLMADPVAAPARHARRAGRRVTVADVYLEDAPANLTVVTGVAVERLALDGRRAVGVVTESGAEHSADRVVVCAGAIGTPALLLRSGVDTPGVGDGLQDHLGVALALELAVPVEVTTPAITVTAEHPDHELLAMEPTVAARGRGVLIGGWLAVRGTGTVALPDPHGPPAVRFPGVDDPADAQGLRGAVRRLFAAADHDAVRELADAVYVDEHGTTLESLRAGGDDAVWAWATAAANPYHHAAGSCRLGVALTGEGWLRGYAGVGVADASALPGVPRHNVFLSVVDLAERVSARWARHPAAP